MPRSEGDLKRAVRWPNEDVMGVPTRPQQALRPGLLAAGVVAATLLALAGTPRAAAEPGPAAGVAEDPARDGVDCATGTAQPGLDPAVDIEAAAVGITTDGGLVFDVLTRGDLAAFFERAYSAAVEVSFRLPGTNENIVAYDQQHDGAREARVVDRNGEPVAGAALVSDVLNSAGNPGAGIRIHVRGVKIADDSSPRPDTRVYFTVSTYSMSTSEAPRLCDRITTEMVPMSLGSRDLAADETLVDAAANAAVDPPTTTAAPPPTQPATTAPPTTAPPTTAPAETDTAGPEEDSGDGLPWIPIVGGGAFLAAVALWWRARHAVPGPAEPPVAQIGIRSHGISADGSSGEQRMRVEGEFED